MRRCQTPNISCLRPESPRSQRPSLPAFSPIEIYDYNNPGAPNAPLSLD